MREAAEKEWEEFKEERAAGIDEINQLRERVAEEESRRKAERRETVDENDGDAKMDGDSPVEGDKARNGEGQNGDVKMQVDDGAETEKTTEKERQEVAKEDKKREATPTPGYDDDAVEY